VRPSASPRPLAWRICRASPINSSIYWKVQSLTDYLLASQSKYHVEHYVPQPGNHWLLSESDGLESVVRIASINCDLPLAEVCDKVELLTA
jgi:Uma2 family endonuclease